MIIFFFFVVVGHKGDKGHDEHYEKSKNAASDHDKKWSNKMGY